VVARGPSQVRVPGPLAALIRRTMARAGRRRHTHSCCSMKSKASNCLPWQASARLAKVGPRVRGTLEHVSDRPRYCPHGHHLLGPGKCDHRLDALRLFVGPGSRASRPGMGHTYTRCLACQTEGRDTIHYAHPHAQHDTSPDALRSDRPATALRFHHLHCTMYLADTPVLP